MFSFPFITRGLRFKLLDGVIPKVITISIAESDDNVVLGICPKVWCQMHENEGVFVLEVRHTPTEAGATLPVFISTTGSVSTASNNRNIPLVNGASDPITGAEISAGNRYWIYYNRCDNVMQMMNYIPAATA